VPDQQHPGAPPPPAARTQPAPRADGQSTPVTEITENTLQAIADITDPGQDGYHDTSSDDADPGQPAPMWDLTNTHRACLSLTTVWPVQRIVW
jgi:hypothetical protein